MWRDTKDWFLRTTLFWYRLSGGGGCIGGRFCAQGMVKACEAFNIFVCNINARVVDMTYEFRNVIHVGLKPSRILHLLEAMLQREESKVKRPPAIGAGEYRCHKTDINNFVLRLYTVFVEAPRCFFCITRVPLHVLLIKMINSYRAFIVAIQA